MIQSLRKTVKILENDRRKFQLQAFDYRQGLFALTQELQNLRHFQKMQVDEANKVFKNQINRLGEVELLLEERLQQQDDELKEMERMTVNWERARRGGLV